MLYQKLAEKRRCREKSTGFSRKAFYCLSDLQALWDNGQLEIVFHHLNKGQQMAIRCKLIRFISFLVLVGVRTTWIADCEHRIFQEPGGCDLRFTDEDKPRFKEELIELGLNHLQASNWEYQYNFRPVTIEFDAERQEVEWPHPLPFQNPHSIAQIHGGYGDSTVGERFGTVKVSVCNQVCSIQGRLLIVLSYTRSRRSMSITNKARFAGSL